MRARPSKFFGICISILISFPVFQAKANREFFDMPRPDISFVEMQSLDLEQEPPDILIIKGKLKLPFKLNPRPQPFPPQRRVPAVVILHGSSGVDSRGDFYAQALNAAGIATLEIDMWEARDVSGGLNRPPLPIFTYPDAFAALEFLANHDNIDPDRIGVLGFSWGAVISMASAEELYANQFGGTPRFAAHVANYPVCYSYNNPNIPPLNPPAARGFQFLELTGAPVLIQIGTEDDYDNGADHCLALVHDLIDPDDRDLVEVAVYAGAFHAWDRLQVPITVFDPFADEGSFFSTGVAPRVEIVPNADQAYASRRKVVKFFLRNL